VIDVENNTGIRYSFFLYTDVVNSTDIKIPDDIQICKISNLQKWILKFLMSQEGVDEVTKIRKYFNSTGDGMLVVFNDRELFEPINLAIYLHKVLNEYNRDKPQESNISLRIGISSGPHPTFFDLTHGKIAPWGYNSIMARRIMDLCNPNQILLSKSVRDTLLEKVLPSENIRLYDYIYKKDIVPIKHDKQGERVYSFYGTIDNIVIGNNDKPMSEDKDIFEFDLDEDARRPIKDFFLAKILYNKESFSKVFEPLGIDLSEEDEILFFKYLFEYSGNYYSGSSLFLPSSFEKRRKAFLDAQWEMFLNFKTESKRTYDEIPTLGTRYLILTKDLLISDINKSRENYDLIRSFILRHQQMKVELYRIEPIDADNAKKQTFPPHLLNSKDTGLWHDKYAIQFEQMNKSFYLPEHTTNDNRRIVFCPKESDMFKAIKQFMDNLDKIKKEGKAERIDLEFLEKYKFTNDVF
jgi:hypothetical protein